MIFVCVGSREYQFDRLLKELDTLVENGTIKEKVIAQIANSSYIPKNYEYIRFLDKVEFDKYQDKADLIISHGGTGALIGALKKKKQIIAVPRLAKYGEHIDDHQTQVAGVLADQKLLMVVLDINKLGETIKTIKKHPITKTYDKKSNVLPLIQDYIEKQEKEKEKKGKKMTPITKSIILAPLNLLYIISPKTTLKLLFWIKQGYKLNLNNPKTYSEKIQWIKLYYKEPIITKLVDKYTVREYVNNKCPGILNEIIWEGFDPKDIPWNKLPEKCVIKVTHGSGLNIICENINLLDRRKTEKTLNRWLNYKFIRCYGEWFYGIEKPRIIIERFIESSGGLNDYKVFCFNGEPKYIGVYSGRQTNSKPYEEIFNIKWELQNGFTGNFEHPNTITKKPNNYEKLLEYAKKLSSQFPHVRVDFYIVKNKIYFGEMTFTSGAGFDKYKPYEFDLEMGKHFKLPEM